LPRSGDGGPVFRRLLLPKSGIPATLPTSVAGEPSLPPVASTAAVNWPIFP